MLYLFTEVDRPDNTTNWSDSGSTAFAYLEEIIPILWSIGIDQDDHNCLVTKKPAFKKSNTA